VRRLGVENCNGRGVERRQRHPRIGRRMLVHQPLPFSNV
jgi:hypothetical protein